MALTNTTSELLLRSVDMGYNENNEMHKVNFGDLPVSWKDVEAATELSILERQEQETEARLRRFGELQKHKSKKQK